MKVPAGLKKVGEYYHYNLKVNGQRLHGSTKASDLATARKVLAEKRAELVTGQIRVAGQIPTLDDLFQKWYEAHKTIFSRKHLQSTECVYRNWIRPLIGPLKIDLINTAIVLDLRGHMLAGGCSPIYANNASKTLKLLLRYAISLELLEKLPYQVKPMKVQRKPRVTIETDKIKQFLDTIDEESQNPHVRVMIRIMIGLGLREGEVLGMRWEWLDCHNRTYTVGKAKGKEARVIPIPAWLWLRIAELPQTSEWIFPAEDGNHRRPQICVKPLKRAASKCGLTGLTQHRLRASFATLHAEIGTPITDIQNMLGHKDITTTQIYIESNLKHRRAAQDILSQRLGF